MRQEDWETLQKTKRVFCLLIELQRKAFFLSIMDLRPIFVSLILWTTNTFAQDSNSPYFFTFLTTSNNPSDFGTATQSPDVKPDDAKEKKNAKPQGVTLPDGTFIPNSPTKSAPENKSEFDIYERFVKKPSLAAELADEGVELAQAALASGKSVGTIPLDNVRAMYAISVFFKYGYHCPKSEENSLEWMMKAALANKNPKSESSDSKRISEQEIHKGISLMKASIAEKQK
jgi:hypothetical protein